MAVVYARLISVQSHRTDKASSILFYVHLHVRLYCNASPITPLCQSMFPCFSSVSAKPCSSRVSTNLTSFYVPKSVRRRPKQGHFSRNLAPNTSSHSAVDTQPCRKLTHTHLFLLDSPMYEHTSTRLVHPSVSCTLWQSAHMPRTEAAGSHRGTCV